MYDMSGGGKFLHFICLLLHFGNKRGQLIEIRLVKKLILFEIDQ